MRFTSFLAGTLLAAGLGLAAGRAAAQTQPTLRSVTPGRNTAYVLVNSAVMERRNNQLTPLSQNVRLPNGTKINVKSGIVELPGGKLTSLHEGDYVNAEGGIVFATPASAAQARGDSTVAADAKFNRYIQVGTALTKVPFDNPTERETLLAQKIELLNRKVKLLTDNAANPPNTQALDRQLSDLDAKLSILK